MVSGQGHHIGNGDPGYRPVPRALDSGKGCQEPESGTVSDHDRPDLSRYRLAQFARGAFPGLGRVYRRPYPFRIGIQPPSDGRGPSVPLRLQQSVLHRDRDALQLPSLRGRRSPAVMPGGRRS